MPWSTARERYLEHLRDLRGCRPNTVLQRRRLLRAWHAHLQAAAVPWHLARPADLTRFRGRRGRRGRELAPATHSAGDSAVRAFYRWAAAVDLLDRDPLELVRPLRAGRPRSRSHPPEVVSRLLQAAERRCGRCRSDACGHVRRRRLAALLAYWTGLRAMEIAGLRWRHVGTERLTVAEGKGGTMRHVALAGPLRRALHLEREALQPGPDDPVVPAEDGGPCSPGAVAALVKRIFLVAGVAGSGHDLRHSLAVHLYHTGADAVEVMQVLGHEDLGTTWRYLRGIIDRTPDALERLSSAFPAAGPGDA